MMDLRAQLIASARDKCRHFNGTIHETCQAGVNYRALVGGPDLGWGLRLPCGLRLPAGKVGDPVACEQRAIYTEDELSQRADDSIRRMDALGVAVKACRTDAAEHGLKRGRGGAGSITCPCCTTGTLRYTVAGLNGHLWGACSTTDCVRWMQ